MWLGGKSVTCSTRRALAEARRRASSEAGSSVTLRIPQGALQGRTQRTSAGKRYNSFLGIPYAKPPVGKLRFQPPEPADKWKGVRDATTHGGFAPQLNIINGQCKGDEDCLYLNIFTPAQTENSGTLKPVMVWFHGGGYIMGSGNADVNGPDYIVNQDVILVTLNYRLGVLGFLGTGDSVVPGNMGLKDQLMALHWIKDNIAIFGGNPACVTLFGGSAGGMSAEYFMLSPKGKGLFHRAISQSGVAIADTICSPEVPERTFRLAKHLGLSTNNSTELLEYMNKIPAITLIENQYKGFSDKDRARLLYFPFLPTVEHGASETDAFINKHPLDILKSNSYSPVPYMLGFNEKEGMIYVRDVSANIKLFSFLEENFQYLVPSDIADNVKDVTPIAEAVRQFYFKNTHLSKDTLDVLLDLLGDKLFAFPVYRAATLHSAQMSTPVYLYQFTVDAGLNSFKRMIGFGDKPGACHADETGYLFRNYLMPIEVQPQSVEETTIAQMTKLWTNFGKTGNPTPEDDPVSNVKWPSFSSNNPFFLNITNDGLKVENSLLKERMSFWEDLYNKLNL